MKIEKIKKGKDGRYTIYFTNREKMTTYDEVILKNNLLTSKEIDEEELKLIEQENSYYKLYRKVLKYASTRFRSKKEIHLYLEKMPFCEEEKNRVLASLKELGLYNDEQFANAYVFDKMYLSRVGPNKMKEDLTNHAVLEEQINKALKQIPEEDIYEKLKKQLLKKWNCDHKTSTNLLKKKLLFEFTNLGYDAQLIEKILATFTSREEDEFLLTQYEKWKSVLERKYEGELLDTKIKQKLYAKGFSLEQIDAIMKKNS